MKITRKLVNALRNWFGTLAFLSLLVAGLAFGAIWIERVGLERDAVAEAGKLARSEVAPALAREDLDGSISAARYAELRAVVRRRALHPPVTSVAIWNMDGMVVFADRASAVGERVPAMHEAIRDARAGSTTRVEGDTLRILVGVDADGGGSAIVEIDRSNADLVEHARERWGPWVGRALGAAGILFVLYLATVGISIVLRRQRARAAEKLPKGLAKTPPRPRPKTAHKPPPSKSPSPVPAGDQAGARRRKGEDGGPPAPAYTQPGFRENVEARREAEAALVSAKQALDASENDRERLQRRLTKREEELQEANRRLGEPGPTRR
jgi:hypothetical protein